MAEDSPMAEVDEFSSNTLAGLSTGDDLTPGVYEGGFKTWECAIDLAQYLAGQWNTIVGTVRTGGLRVIEVCDLYYSLHYELFCFTNSTSSLSHFQNDECKNKNLTFLS